MHHESQLPVAFQRQWSPKEEINMNQDDPDGSAKKGNSDKQTASKDEDLKESLKIYGETWVLASAQE